MKKIFFLYVYFMLFLFAVGCSPLKNSNYEEYLSLKFEAPACEKNYSYTRTTTLTGTASYYKRGLNLVIQDSKILNMHLGDPMSLPLPIRFAEVAVYDSANAVVQCGKTDNDGQIKAIDAVSDLKIPATADTYTVRVFSRINYTLSFAGKPDFDINVAVKKDKYNNELYSIAASTSSNGTEDSNVTLTAYARQTDSEEINGGAFNILNAIYTAYDYVRSNTGTTNTTCMNEKLNVYWKAGFNPLQYYYPQEDPSYLSSNSYYNNAEKFLYITGGKLGNINIERTDHFGDYVIIHELGHHVENVCGSLLSPGGTHAMIARIDSRLAWGEAWSNYFAAQVMFNQVDTLLPDFRQKMTNAGFSNTNYTYLFASEGFSDSVQNIGNGSGFMMDLKKDGKNPDTWQSGSFFGMSFDKVDPSKYKGEGHFREGAITRGLFKLSNNCGTGGTCIDYLSGTPIDFGSMWMSMDKITGMGSNAYPFKGSGTFMEILKDTVGSANWTANYKTFNELTTSEALHLFSDGAFTSVSGTDTINKWIPYGKYLTSRTSGVCAAGIFYIEPRFDDPVLTATNSDQRYSNHFYTLDMNLMSGVDQINVDFQKISSTGTNTEFDVILFSEDYFYAQDYACVTTDSTTGNCTSYLPTRESTSDIIKSDRRAGASFTRKTINGLASLPTNKRYLLNIRAYTANKSINSTTDYKYTITDQSGFTLCP